MVSKLLASNILQLAVRSGGQILDVYWLLSPIWPGFKLSAVLVISGNTYSIFMCNRLNTGVSLSLCF